MSDPVLQTVPLGRQWGTADPFLFCVHHLDRYPAANEHMGPARIARRSRHRCRHHDSRRDRLRLSLPASSSWWPPDLCSGSASAGTIPVLRRLHESSDLEPSGPWPRSWDWSSPCRPDGFDRGPTRSALAPVVGRRRRAGVAHPLGPRCDTGGSGGLPAVQNAGIPSLPGSRSRASRLGLLTICSSSPRASIGGARTRVGPGRPVAAP